MPRSEFIHLHLHTQYSLLDGACRIPELLRLARQYNMDSLAITDHGNMFGAIDFYIEAQNAGIKPIVGCEFYIAPQSRFEKSSRGIEEASYHLLLLAKDEIGYQNLMRLVSAGYLEGFYYRPRIDKELLSTYKSGLIGLSACLKGEIPVLLQEKRFHDALKVADEYLNILGRGNFYLEIQQNFIPEQKIVNEGLIRISRELDIPLVATNDVHYLTEELARSHEALLCIQTQTTLSDPNRMRFQTDEFYFKSPEQMKKLFSDIPEAISNALEIASRCNLELDFSKVHLPKYEPPQGLSKEEYLRKLTEDGIKARYKEVTATVQERLGHELRIIKDMGFTSYFLIVWDFVRYAKDQGIPVGPGRGSAAASLVSYILGITDIDPLRYGLLFERFLNPERIGLPDIDIDFCYERRQEVIDYVTKKYGQENVAQIITFGTMQARAVVRDVGRVMGLSYADVDRIAKMIPPDPSLGLKDALESETELHNLYQNDPTIKQLIDTALSLEGLNRHASIHAAGVVIGDKPLNNYMPLFKTQDEQITTGYSMSVLEKIGLLKVDFLGLRTLTVIDETVKLIQQKQGIRIDITSIPLDDPVTYKLLSLAQTIGVFQLESSGMRDLLRKLEPERFEDVIALLALYRPGPIGSGLLDDFIQRRHNRIPIRYDHKKLEPLLKETYGIMVYQEQIMQIASSLAGFSLPQADLLRRAMSKKNPDVMEQQRLHFVSGCVKNGISEVIAHKTFDFIEYFSGYGFNKCVVGYTKIIDASSGKVTTVKELFDNKGTVKFTLSCDDNLKIVKTKIKDVVYNGIKPIYRLKTALGKEIVATSNHPVLTFLGWKNLGDLRIGERIALCRTVSVGWNSSLEPHKIIVLAGIISEGNTCHPSGIYYYNNDKLLVGDFIKNVKKFDNSVTYTYKRRNCFEVYIGTGKDTRFAKGQIPWNKGFIPPSQKTTCMHVDVRQNTWRIRQELWRKCEEKAARRDVTKWASYSSRRDNPEEYAEIIAREFRHGLGVGVNKGTTGMPVGLFSIKDSYPSAVKLQATKKCGLRLWIEQLELDYKKATEKFIPEEIFTLNKEQLALFLGRLWSGDGFIFSKNNATPFYATSSKKLCQQLQDLLLRFGIISRLVEKTFDYKYKETRSPRIGYTVYLFGYDSISIFIHQICPFIIGRLEQIEALRNYYRQVPPNLESKDTLPSEIREIVKSEKEKCGLTWREIEKRTGICMEEFYGKAKVYKKGFRRRTIKELAHFFESPKLLRYVNSDIVWDRVISVEYVGRDETYDLEIEGIHNFVANGIIVHNSHSAAYALISYRTAYFKANYPVEFMTALLTSERDNTDKIVEYVNEAGRMGIKVLPPDINESDVRFKAIDKKTIRFGLLAVKNVGRAAIESIIQARSQGPFTSLEELCQRIDLRLVNRKVLESLIKCGALDGFGFARAQMFASLDTLLERASRSQRERSKGQFSFFDLGSSPNGFKEKLLTIPQVKEWPEPQILAFEKEMLGFYISGHPLARYAGKLKRFSSISTAELSNQSDAEEIKIVGLIAKIKQTTTRAKQEKMAILKLEDLEGAVEVLVFPAAYAKVSRFIQPNTVVLVKGRLNLREDTPKIVANDLFPVEEIYKLISRMNINLSGVRENLFVSLKELLASSPGSIPVYIHLDTPTKARVQLLVGDGLFVGPNEKFIEEIENLLGEERLTLVI